MLSPRTCEARSVRYLLRTRHSIQAKRDESGRDVSLRMVLVQFVGPNRIELIQLIVQRVAAIFRHQDGVFIIHERDIIERRMVGVAKDNERDVSSLAVCVEIDTEDSGPGAARCQHRVCARGIIRIASDDKEERLKM